MWAKARIAFSSRTKVATFIGEIATLRKAHGFLAFRIPHIEWMMVAPLAVVLASGHASARHDNNMLRSTTR